MDDNQTVSKRVCDDPNTYNYSFSGRIMLISVVGLFIVCIIIVCFHSYARWSLNRHLRRYHLRQNSRPNNLPPRSRAAANTLQGLDCVVLASIPTFTYHSASHQPPLECAVCLSEFEDDETGRVFPKCNHCFHVDCIDMWFHSHSNCPLCRAPVHPPTLAQITIQTVPDPPVSEAEPSSSNQDPMTSSSSAPALEGIAVEVPVTDEGSRNPGDVDVGSSSDSGIEKSGTPGRTLKRF